MQNTEAYDAGFAVGQVVGGICCPITCLIVMVGLIGGGVFWFLRRNKG
jgi:hypothetical protein